MFTQGLTALLQNAFSDRLSPLGFDLFSMLLPDFMHEVELGGWRALFIHLLRMLQTVDEERIVELDRRYVEYFALMDQSPSNSVPLDFEKFPHLEEIPFAGSH